MAYQETSKLIVVDLEATCWANNQPQRSSEIIEIGICIVDLSSLRIERPYSFVVRPFNLDISPFCTELTGFTKEDIMQEGRYLHEVLNSIRKEYPLASCCWGSWGWYDRNQIERECRDKQIDNPFSANHFNIKQIHAMFRGLPKGIGMEAALRKENIELKGRHHRGVSDAMNTARLVLRLFRNANDASNIRELTWL